MTPEQRAEIRARADAATDGPWRQTRWADQSTAGRDCIASTNGYEIIRVARACLRDADAAFIAAARTDIPDLLDDIERLEAEVERLRAKVERVDALVETWLNRNISWRSSAEYVQAALDGEG